MKQVRLSEPEELTKGTEPGPEPEPLRTPTRRRSGNDAIDLLAPPRCPVCGYPLVARMTCLGPRFPCPCTDPLE